MRKLMILVLIAIAGYLAWQKTEAHTSTLESLYEQPYIVVYGRDTCGWTQQSLGDLRNSGIQVIYKNLDDATVGDELHPRMRQTGLDTSYYLLPVIDVNSKIFIRPEMETVLASFTDRSDID